MRQLRLLIAFLPLVVSVAHADDLDDFIREQLRKRQVPGLSIAIIQNGKIVRAQGYGLSIKTGKYPLLPPRYSRPVRSVNRLQQWVP